MKAEVRRRSQSTCSHVRNRSQTRFSQGVAPGSAEHIKVFCRFRRQQAASSSVQYGEDSTSVYVPGCPEHSEKPFCFDHVFQGSCSQAEVYERVAQPVVEALLEGINGTICAYGHTASGKTYTMCGDIGCDQQQGIIPRISKSLFEGIAEKSNHLEFHVKVSVVEIYKEHIHDLIDPTKRSLKIYEDKTGTVKLIGAHEYYVSCAEDILELWDVASRNRAVGATDMNEHSSRSHLVFTVMVEQRDIGNQLVKAGKMQLVDLAGSELASKAFHPHRGSESPRLEESKSINTSLSALGNVIRVLSETNPGEKDPYVPYRNSKLTRLLKQSLGGCARTALIITCSPGKEHEHETMSTLRFGQRAKTIENVVKANVELASDPLLSEAYQQIVALTAILHDNGIPLPEKIQTFSYRMMLETGQEDLASVCHRTVATPSVASTKERIITGNDSATSSDVEGAPSESRCATRYEDTGLSPVFEATKDLIESMDPFSTGCSSSSLVETERLDSCIPDDPRFSHMRELLQEMDRNLAHVGKLYKRVVEGKVQLNQALADVRATRWQLEKEALSVRKMPQAQRRRPPSVELPDSLKDSDDETLLGIKEALGIDGREPADSFDVAEERETCTRLRLHSDSSICERPRIARPVRGGSSNSLGTLGTWGSERAGVSR